MVGTDKSRFQVWQPGWTGGAMSGYALMKLGENRSGTGKSGRFLFSSPPSVKADFSTEWWTWRGILTGMPLRDPVPTIGI